jgi:hypothetical protein
LAGLHSKAVDSAKTGETITIPHNLKSQEFPHHMREQFEKKDKGKAKKERKYYESTGILGKLYDNANNTIKSLERQENYEIVEDDDLRVEGWKSFIEIAEKERTEYNKECAQMKAVKLEGEEKHSQFEKIRKKYRANFLHQISKNPESAWQVASAYYLVSYKNRRTKPGEFPAVSFAWNVCLDRLCEIKAAAVNSKYPRLDSESPLVVTPHFLFQLKPKSKQKQREQNKNRHQF